MVARVYLWNPAHVKSHMQESDLEMLHNLMTYHGDKVKYFDFIQHTLSFTETTDIVDGNEIFNTELSGVIPKIRKEAIKSLIELKRTRVISQAKDRNDLSRIIGRLDSPAVLLWKASTKPEFEGLNAIELTIKVTYSKPAAFANTI